ncbi:type II toxin-antitoxin system VapC family toxin [Rhizobium mongolense]|uniref:type II toxin-antitoxin system VapC family toxin n=1 Tax=Rhizobium mongolense TaxID=57676 RepID=UPI0035564B1B
MELLRQARHFRACCVGGVVRSLSQETDSDGRSRGSDPGISAVCRDRSRIDNIASAPLKNRAAIVSNRNSALNLADCFHYAAAKAGKMPILTRDAGFALTDLKTNGPDF